MSSEPVSHEHLKERAEAILQRAVLFRQEEAPAWGEQIERTGEIPSGLWERMRNLGFRRLTLPQWAGGEGLPLEMYFPILEEMSHNHGSIRMIFHVSNSIWRTIAKGSEEQQKYWLPRVANGDAVVAFALTEPDNGTGIDLQTTAVYENGKFVLNGRKHLITFAHEADVTVVIAKTDASLGRYGLTAFLVPRGRDGMKLEPMPEMMGDKGCSHAIVTFDQCVVSEEEVLGSVGQGFEIALRGFLDQSRASIAQSAVGLAQEAQDRALDFVRRRTTFGKPLSSRQAVQMRLADMATLTQAARLLCLDAARKFDAGLDIAREAAMAKGFAIRMVREVTDGALALYGGVGYAVNSPVERLYRDARSLWFEEGTLEMQNMTVAESLLSDARKRDRQQRQTAATIVD
ncbi:acyl-CoA dehydrogenase family protein [Alicyclobacillus tolerans]|uniref:acyl-CoA dehydrogenase family protein n=1 Tax=Alicyclobacillus tolerans TaxID=90970 RepID=UPI001F20D11F|nr:acyl-CoA dehydrogenase family protein [Alicyclobacillus tolerans]MCF8566557.1 acyl-CoA dehydrogenase family protein [Alicyclobacillus tolerans]